MKSRRTPFPDISDILAQKEDRRRAAAARSFGQKIATIEALRERLAPFKQARLARELAKLGREDDSTES
jgi:hypothetical protein